MEPIKKLLEAIQARLSRVALKDAVVSKPLSVAERHVLVLSEVSWGFGGGSGTGENAENHRGPAKGSGGGAGGAAKTSPVAVLVVEQGKVRLERIGR